MNSPITMQTITNQQVNADSTGKLRILPSSIKAKKLVRRSSKDNEPESLAIAQGRQGMRLTLHNIELYSTVNGQTNLRRLPGLHENGDGSTMLVDAAGMIRSFKTAPTQEFPEGLSYNDIRHDEHGHMLSCETPWDSMFQRVGPSEPTGVACWINSRDGLPTLYIGADEPTWFGIMSVDERGFHSYVTSGRYERVLYTRAGDGSLCRTRPRVVDGITTGLETVTTLPDKSRVVHQLRFLGERAVFEKSVEVFNTNRTNKYTVEVDELNSNYRIVETTGILENFNLGAVMHQLLLNGLTVDDITSDTTARTVSRSTRLTNR
ncbi:MAG: hypothetical protein K2X93_22920 [Candidatus Obscuribacterales bacterium]|nr:hypothetical protein [Candidatus Obscuribacterales bacterium]